MLLFFWVILCACFFPSCFVVFPTISWNYSVITLNSGLKCPAASVRIIVVSSGCHTSKALVKTCWQFLLNLVWMSFTRAYVIDG